MVHFISLGLERFFAGYFLSFAGGVKPLLSDFHDALSNESSDDSAVLEAISFVDEVESSKSGNGANKDQYTIAGRLFLLLLCFGGGCCY